METKFTSSASPSAEPQIDWNAPKLMVINKSTIEGGYDPTLPEATFTFAKGS